MSQLEVVDLTLEVPGRRLLDRAAFAAETGECVAVMGPSGSGKTSLLNCLSGITRPTTGAVRLDGTELSALGNAARAAFRLRRVGLVFQAGELLPELTVAENVALPLRLQGVARREADARALAWLERLGLGDRGAAHPDVLSGGEVQRVGIARALAHGPALVLADEPTGALDEANAVRVAELLVGTAKDLGATVVVATHDPLVAARADRVLRLHEGRLVPAEPGRPTPLRPNLDLTGPALAVGS